MKNNVIYQETDDQKKLDRFFMMNELEYSEEHPVASAMRASSSESITGKTRFRLYKIRPPF